MASLKIMSDKKMQTVFRAKNEAKKSKLQNSSKSYVLNNITQSIEKCVIHGDFVVYPSDKIKGNHGCKICKKEKQFAEKTQKFIERAKNFHKEKYSYKNTLVKKESEKIIITCSEHGDFLETTANHLNGSGCIKCDYKNNFISNANELHKDKYSYSEVKYENQKTPVMIKCKKHGFFEMTPLNHLKGKGCPHCKTEDEKFIKKLNEIHEKKYTYKNVKSTALKNKINVVCKLHGDFEITVQAHVNGAGCPSCNPSLMPKESKQLIKVDNVLNEFDMQKEKRFAECRNVYPLPFDRYVESLNLCIEYDGRQHFDVIDFLGNEKLSQQQLHDEIKNNYCIENKINLLRIKYTQDAEEEVIKMLDLLETKPGKSCSMIHGEVQYY